MKKNTKKVVELNKAKKQLNEYNGFKELQKSVGGLPTITDEKLALIASKMPEIDRAITQQVVHKLKLLIS